MAAWEGDAGKRARTNGEGDIVAGLEPDIRLGLGVGHFVR